MLIESLCTNLWDFNFSYKFEECAVVINIWNFIEELFKYVKGELVYILKTRVSQSFLQ